jgi:hypothetical protein
MVKTCNDPQDQETCTIIAVGMAVKLPIMMPGMDAAQFEQDGGTTFNADEPTATQEEKQQADKKNAERAKKQAEAGQQQQRGAEGSSQKASSNKKEKKLSNHDKAAIGESVAHKHMLDNGYKPLGNTNGQYQQGQTGIDGVYEAPEAKQPPKYVIVEAKYGSSQLIKETNDGRQMSDPWVVSEKPNRLENKGLTEDQQDEIRDGLNTNNGDVSKIVIRTDEKGFKSAKTVKKDGYMKRGKSAKYNL